MASNSKAVKVKLSSLPSFLSRMNWTSKITFEAVCYCGLLDKLVINKTLKDGYLETISLSAAILADKQKTITLTQKPKYNYKIKYILIN